MVYMLKNPRSGGANAEDLQQQIMAQAVTKDQEFCEKDLTQIENMVAFLRALAPEDIVVIVGGDGTLNHLANDIRGYVPKNPLYLYGGGTGNDFMHDVIPDAEREATKLLQINDYITNLPVVVIDGEAHTFVNNAAYGLDGEVCVLGEDAKAAGVEKVNYTSLAIKLLLRYKVCDVKIVVDGETYEYKKTWLAPVMNGKFYGGGMMITPEQKRQSENMSFCTFFGTGRLRTLMIFPKIFSGEHVKYVKNIAIKEGKDIEVTMSVPKDVHLDGEVFRQVKSMHAYKGEAAHQFDKYTADGEKL